MSHANGSSDNNNGESESGRATPLPERKIITEMSKNYGNSNNNGQRPKSRGKTPNYLKSKAVHSKNSNHDDKNDNDVGRGWDVGNSNSDIDYDYNHNDNDNETIPKPSKVEEGVEMLILGHENNNENEYNSEEVSENKSGIVMDSNGQMSYVYFSR